jgi:hypothetical protein
MREKKHLKLLVCSLLAIVASVTCLVSFTWAWMITSQNYDLGSIQFASYHVTEKVIKEESVEDADVEGEENTGKKDKKDAEDAQDLVKYTIRLTTKGDMETGYCKITIKDKAYYTEQMAPESKLTFSLILSKQDYEQVEYSSQWGIYEGKADITDGVIINEKGEVVQDEEVVEEVTTEVESETEAETEIETESETEEVMTEAETEVETESETEVETQEESTAETESEEETSQADEAAGVSQE